MRYQKRISGPLLDRIDIHVEVPRVDYEKLADKRGVENSTTIRARVQGTRERQLQGFAGTRLTCNAEMGPSEVRDFCAVDPAAEKLLKVAMQQLHLSARVYQRVLKLARTIADLEGSDGIAANHVAEAIQYRSRAGHVPKGQGEQKGLILLGCLRSLSQAVSGGSKEICREMVRTVIGISVRRIAATVASDCAL